MHRFFVSQNTISVNNFQLDDKDQIRQIVKVLRLKTGDEIIIFCGDRKEYLIELAEITPNSIRGAVKNTFEPKRETSIDLTLWQALIKSDKLEWILQKSTELGVKKIVLFTGRHSEVKDVSPAKLLRYQKILIEATEQCGGVIVPELIVAKLLDKALKIVPFDKGSINLIPVVGATDHFTKFISPKLSQLSYNIAIGPEGDFDADEIISAKQYGFTPVSLGARVLRSETAAISLAAKILL